MTYAATKFEVATSKGLEEDTFSRNVTDGQTNGRRTDFGTKLMYHFSEEKSGYNKYSKFDSNIAKVYEDFRFFLIL